MAIVMTAAEFVDKLSVIAYNFKTLYVMGCFGAPLVGTNVERYCVNHKYNRQAERTEMIRKAGDKNPPVYGFDCVCLIKGVLWGWNGDVNSKDGGAKYNTNGVVDVGANLMIQKCEEISTDFNDILPGEAVWKSGHIGVYIGNGLAIESTPAWKNGVQVTAISNIGTKIGYNSQRWTKHGKLPWIDYGEANKIVGEEKLDFAVNDIVKFTGIKHYIGANSTYGSTCRSGEVKITQIKKGAKHPYHVIYTIDGGSNAYGWVDASDIYNKVGPYETYTVKTGDTLWQIAKEYLGSGTKYTEIMKINELKTSTIRTGQVLKIPK